MDPLSTACLAALYSVSRAVLSRIDIPDLIDRIPLDALPFDGEAADKLRDAVTGGVIGNRADGLLVRVFGDTVNEFVGNLKEPKNHDLLKGLSLAHARAFRFYAATLRRQAATGEERKLADKISRLRPARLLSAETVCREIAELAPALIAQSGAMSADERQRRMLGAIVTELRSWIEREVQAPLPRPFEAWLTETSPKGRASWRDKFQLYLGERIKGDQRYERIFVASNLAEVLQRTITLQEIGEDLRTRFDVVVALVAGVKDEVSRLTEEIARLNAVVGALATLLENGAKSELSPAQLRQIISLAGGDAALSPEATATEMLDWLRTWIPQARSLAQRAEVDPVRRRTLETLTAYVAERRGGSNPYKGLACFDVGDHGQFHGRKEDVAWASDVLGDMLAEKRRPAALCVSGETGAGKSSFLRAGVLGALTQRKDVQIVVLAANDLFNRQHLASALLQAVDAQTGLAIFSREVQTCARLDSAAAIEVACDAVAEAARAANVKLVFAFDQLEEIVDHWASEGAESAAEQRRWRDLFAFMAGLVARRVGPVVYTLESRRVEYLRRCHADDIFNPQRVTRIDLDAPSEAMFAEIITAPFLAAGHHLAPSLVTALLAEIAPLNHGAPAGRRLSILPLLSLKLAKLYERVDMRFAPRDPLTLDPSDPERAGSGFVRAKDLDAVENHVLRPFDLSLVSEISDLADEAWRQATHNTAQDPDDYDFFLSFVGLADVEDKLLIQLKVVPEASLFLQRRLLTSLTKLRLVVASHGLCQLGHEAILRSWAPARDWLARRAPLLRAEHRLRARAAAWDASGRPADDEASSELDHYAGEMLAAQRRVWASRRAVLAAPDAQLRAFCLARFAAVDNARAPFGSTSAIHLAASYGLGDTLERMLEKDPDAIDLISGMARRTPLFQAVAYGWPLAARLLKRGADPRKADRQGWTPLSSAIWFDNETAFDEIFPQVADAPPASPLGTLLHDCAAADQVAIARKIVQAGRISLLTASGGGLLPVHQAAVFGHVQAFGFFSALSDPFASTADGSHALHLACAHGRVAIVEALMTHKGFRDHVLDRDHNGWNALHTAAAGHHAQLVRLLLDHADLNAPVTTGPDAGATPLILAVSKALGAATDAGATDTVEALLASERTDVNAKDAKGRTALSIATALPRLSRLILGDERLDVAAEDPSILKTIAEGGNWQLLRRLLARAASGQAHPEWTPLPYVAEANDLPDDLADFMLEHWPPSLKVADESLALAAGGNNVHLGLRLLDRASPGTEAVAGLLWRAAAEGAAPETIDRILARTKAGWRSVYWSGVSVLHRLCAAQLIERLPTDAVSRSDLHGLQDAYGRTPLSLLTPASRKRLGLESTGIAWPTQGAWDVGVEWTAVPPDPATAVRVADRTGALASDLIEYGALSFYGPGAALLVRVTAEAATRPSYFVLLPSRLQPLKGESAPIYAANYRANLCLDPDAPDAARDYLRFFGNFVHGSSGSFLCLEGNDHAGVPSGYTAAEMAALADLATAPQVAFDTVNDRFVITACLLYDEAVWATDFEIKRNGEPKMANSVAIRKNLSLATQRPQ